MIKNLERLYYTILYALAHNGIIHLVTLIEEATKAEMPFHYHWSEAYINRIEYLRRRSKGIPTTFKEVEQEYLMKCSQDLQKAIKEFEKQRIKVAKLYEKVTNQRKDFLHKLSTQIINEYDSVAIENLNISGMIRNRNLSRGIADASWGTFVDMLKYKAEWSGKNILQIGRFEPSSKMCSCGKINNELKLSQREWGCKYCNIKHDRDVLASNNIKRFGLGQNQAIAKADH